jgi:hypothetical protein
MTDRQTAPAADRNKEAILGVLRRFLPDTGLVLEIASGTGQHVVHFAQALRQLEWQPSDPDPQARSSISAWIGHVNVPNIRPPLNLDVSSNPWPLQQAHAVVCINMVHISPWSATLGLMGGAAGLLPTRGPLIVYGPFRHLDRETAPSNEAFDAELRQRNPEWGLRDVQAVARVAEENGLRLVEVVEMPANNSTLVFRNAGTI